MGEERVRWPIAYLRIRRARGMGDEQRAAARTAAGA
jgi:hypothetical protein